MGLYLFGGLHVHVKIRTVVDHLCGEDLDVVTRCKASSLKPPSGAPRVPEDTSLCRPETPDRV